MNQLQNTNGNGLTVKSTKIVRLSEDGLSVNEVKPMLLLDISGSMGASVNGERKIDTLRNAVKDMHNARMFAFSERCSEVQYGIPEPETSTDLAHAFRYLKKWITTKDANLLLVSDGIPDDKEDALYEAKTLNIPINVLFIGTEGSDGEEFMQTLAKITGGKQVTADTAFSDFKQQLSNGINQLLLGSG
jgi:Mg-chelatase subunit ChlD